MKAAKYFISLLILFAMISACKKDKVLHCEKIKKNHGLNVSEKSSPVLVWTSQSQPDPTDIPPAIFYTPHQDDETIGMGASIAEHVRAGRPVYVVLLTNGANPDMLTYLQSNYMADAGMQDLIDARNREFIAACKALGVHRIYIANGGVGFDDQTVGVVGSSGWKAIKNDFEKTMHYFANEFPNASHKTVSGNCDSYNSGCAKNSTHQAAAKALHDLYNKGIIEDVRLYRVYCYYWSCNTCDPCSNYFSAVADADKVKKQEAINQYKLIDTDHQRYGLAYNFSTPTLFDNCWNSKYEYVDFVKNDN